MNDAQLMEVLKLHSLWRLRDPKGKQAELSKRNLSGANLSVADLRGADLRGANLTNAYLVEANLTNANLDCANLTYANLRGAHLFRAVLSEANLTGANLCGADLRLAILSGANLSGTNLDMAILSKTDLWDAKIDDKTKLPTYQILPSHGQFTAWKKVIRNCGDYDDSAIIRLRVLPKAQRVSTPIGRKCRVEYARVISAETLYGEPIIGESFKSLTLNHKKIIYTIGEIVRPGKFDPDIRVMCSGGIHVFLTKQEAIDYDEMVQQVTALSGAIAR
jgi:uncharacterized protein YjbI with pentapeptide repeats